MSTKKRSHERESSSGRFIRARAGGRGGPGSGWGRASRPVAARATAALLSIAPSTCHRGNERVRNMGVGERNGGVDGGPNARSRGELEQAPLEGRFLRWPVLGIALALIGLVAAGVALSVLVFFSVLFFFFSSLS